MPDQPSGAVLTEAEEERKARKRQEKAAHARALAELAATSATKAIEAALENQAKQVKSEDRPDITPAAEPEFDTANPESGVALPKQLKSVEHHGKVIDFPLTPGGLRGYRTEGGDALGALVDRAIDKHISINRFPRDFDAKDFSMARYCMAVEESRNTIQGNLAFQKIAPREHAYYEALHYYGKESKALGEMTSGQDGGFLAPEIWTNVFFDISGVAA